MNDGQYKVSQYASQIQEAVQHCESLRRNSENPLDTTFEQFIQKKWNISLDALFEDLGVDPNLDTIQNIFTLPDNSVRWLIPEIIREALRLGLRKNPIWSNLIASEQSVKNPSVTLPHLNMSDAAPKYVGEAETIPLGTVSFGQKTFKLNKIGRGVKIPYEVKNYVSINVISIFLQDFGVKLSQAIDALLIDTLINGEQADGSESAPVVGITTPGTLVYEDLLRVWVRMSRIGRGPSSIIGGEAAALGTLSLPEFKNKVVGSPLASIDLKTPVPTTTNYYVHGNVPADQQIIIDPSAAIIKYNAQPLLVETEKIVSNQTEASYATLTTGFGIAFRDARLIMDNSLDFATDGFPTYMDADAFENVVIN